MAHSFNFTDVHVSNDDGRVKIRMDLDMERFEKQYTRAQFLLDSEIMTCMIPYMPMITGTFINVTKAMSAAIAGSGYVYAAAPPYGRFLYKGKTMVGPTGSTWARYGEKKVLVSQYAGKTNAREDLQYTDEFHPRVGAEWFELAKKRYGRAWIQHAKARAGDGRK